ncbi:hypothetical protein IMSAGC021_01098 [Muribaculaceae bacterium]|nr:hypothetical protein IMSAGC021_01098 [Muribaculaceae bacterium]
MTHHFNRLPEIEPDICQLRIEHFKRVFKLRNRFFISICHAVLRFAFCIRFEFDKGKQICMYKRTVSHPALRTLEKPVVNR